MNFYYNLVLEYITLIGAVEVLAILVLLLFIQYHHPFYVVLSFLGIIGLFFIWLQLLGAEFIALILLVIYAGVFSIIFLFMLILYPSSPREFKSVNYDRYAAGVGYFFIFIYNLCDYVADKIGLVVTFSSYKISYDWPERDMLVLGTIFNDYTSTIVYCAVLLLTTLVGALAITENYTVYSKQL